MSKRKRTVRSFNTLVGREETRYNLKIFNVLKKEKAISISEISAGADVPEEFVAGYINSCVKADLMKISGAHRGELVEFSDDHKKVLGVGFSQGKCYIKLLDLKGDVLGDKEIEIGRIGWNTAKTRDMRGILDKIDGGGKEKNDDICLTGIALPEDISDRNASILADGINGIFDSDVCMGKEPTPSGYIQKDLADRSKGRDVLYMHSDRGAGVVFKGEEVFEANAEDGEGRKYLKPWRQFSIVTAAKDLVCKGVGTDIVNMAGGNIDNITLEIVLSAAANKDELAEDLVKRSSLALGVRIAYLVNMFKPEIVVMGGGVEDKKSKFVQLTRESVERFFIKGQSAPEIVSGKTGGDVSSNGAASLCRREIFMEV
ncbi:MAG: ROK family protein [Candidatus Omnitrophota bacterium]|nr:ROK family protein [Candidatus Omnitrophota bacterium]